MSDLLLKLGQNPNARKIIKGLGLPIPMPQKLRRANGPLVERPLQDMNIVVSGTNGASLSKVLATTLTAAGANPHILGNGMLQSFQAPGEAFGRPAKVLDLPSLDIKSLKADALLFDATGISAPAELRALYDFFTKSLRILKRCGRVVVIGRPPTDEGGPDGAAAQAALEGFVRSVGKEIGRKGSTANLIVVEAGAEERLHGPVLFLLSPRSAFVTCQPIRLTTSAASKNGDFLREQPLENKIALVTGAARGIGKVTAQRLAAEGAHVVCLDRPDDDVATSRLARKIGGTALLLDITDEDAPARIAEALEALGGVDVIVHNAGVTRDKTLARMKPEDWDLVLNVNLRAVARITEALLEECLHDNGRIVCLSSVAGIAGNVGQTSYAASKSGLIGYVKKLSEELAERGITVNAVAPGFIETRLTARIPPMIREAGRRLSALGQGGQPIDVAEVITFLATPAAVGLTGHVLRICGGALIGA